MDSPEMVVGAVGLLFEMVRTFYGLDKARALFIEAALPKKQDRKRFVDQRLCDFFDFMRQHGVDAEKTAELLMGGEQDQQFGRDLFGLNRTEADSLRKRMDRLRRPSDKTD